MPQFNTFQYNKIRYGVGGYSLYDELDKLQDTKPLVKVEFIDTSDTITDISSYYHSGGVIERVKERAPDELQAGDFDVVLFNHDNYFSEYRTGSLFYETQYHNAKIRISLGFTLPDGSEEYLPQQTGFIDELVADRMEGLVTIRCRDVIRRILDEKLHRRPTAEVPTAGSSNTGNGICSTVDTKPFKTVNEDWTLTCTTGGGDGTGEFSVVGSTSGNVGTATSGTEFSTGTGAGGVKFTIKAGGTAWVSGDTFTFSTKQHPEWSAENPGKIIWSVLTGYNWDTNTQENWHDSVFDLDNTQSSSNTDIDYTNFNTVIGTFGASNNITGYVDYEEDPANFLEGILIQFLGAMFTDGDGRVTIRTNTPLFASYLGIREYSESKKVSAFGYARSINEVINHIEIKYKATDSWEFSDETVVYDGIYAKEDSSSISKYNKISFVWTSRWFSTDGFHATDLSEKLINKYKEPPLSVNLTTGLDGIVTDVGEFVKVTDTKYGFSGTAGEVSHLVKIFEESPMKIEMTVRRDEDIATNWAFLGSSADEGDGISPQTANYDSATDTDKLFCYLSQTGGGDPDYRLF